jgi:hypothetical protein
MNDSAPASTLSIISDEAQLIIGGTTGGNARGLKISTGSTGYQSNDTVILDAQNAASGEFLIKTQSVERLSLSATEAVFNDTGVDTDFRVESNDDTHMLFVDAGNNRVGIRTNAPGDVFEVYGSGSGTGVFLNNMGTTNGGRYIYDQAYFNIGALGSSGAPYLGYAVRAEYAASNTYVSTTAVAVGRAAIDVGAAGNGNIRLWTGGPQTPASGSALTDWSLRLTIDPDGNWTQSSDGGTGVVFNSTGVDQDFRVESDTDTHAFFVDAGNNRIGMGASSPSTVLHINRASGATLVRTEVSAGSEVGFDIVKTGATNQHWRIADGTVANGTLEIYDVTNSRSNFRTSSTQSVFNENGADIDFRVESDTSTHGLFLDAAQSSVSVNTSSTAAFFNVQGSATRIISQELGNSTDQGTAQFNRIVKYCPSVSSNNKLIIPFVSQGSLNSNTVCRVMGHNAAYNTSIPQGFEITFAVGHLNAMYSLSYWGAGGNAVSAALNGQTVEITFSSSYNVAYGISGGVFVTLEYMTNVAGYSINASGIALN